MLPNNIDIDRYIDYENEYRKYVEKPKIVGNRMTCLCPFHDDKNASFSIDLKSGKYNCFACGESGNFINFYAEMNKLSTSDAFKAICEEHNIQLEHHNDDKKEAKKDNSENKGPKPFTLEEYSLQKKIPTDWLVDNCRLSTEKDRRTGITYLKEPYYDNNGNEVTYRKRYANKEFRWKYGSAGKIGMYGEWRLPQLEKAGYAILVEGESDTQTLWYLRFAAIGIPGANLFKTEFCKKLGGLKLYIHVEPDQGGDTFYNQMCNKLREGNFDGEVYSFSCSQFGVKDPSELYLKNGKDIANQQIHQAISNAIKVDIYDVKSTIPTVIDDAPIQLRQPEGFKYSDEGIFNYKDNIPNLICRTPILITRRLQSLKSYSEKIEIAFKRDRKWHTAIFNRSTIFQSKNITVLSDLGCTVTSENAKKVVAFLSALEACNMDIITKCSTTSTFGWQDENQFLPGAMDSEYVLDVDPQLQTWADAFEQSGTLEEWIDMVSPYRDRYKFRFILATAFATPLLRLLKQRTFTVYNWGNSKGGKTAALKSALSAWGNPERLMVNFNITQVALEHMAEFFCDLPLGIDERQLAGNNNQNLLEKFIYMLSSEIGKGRGSKTGGLQQVSKWKTIAMMTGEEPISLDTTQSGVSTRTVEIYGGPFENEIEASKMHKDTAEYHGVAGPYFMQRLVKLDLKELKNKFNYMQEELSEFDSCNGAHLSDIALIAIADYLMDSWIFNKSDELLEDSFVKAYEMAYNIMNEQMTSGSVDVNEAAKQFIIDWIISNRDCFGTNVIGTCLGKIDNGICYILPSMFNQALTKAGYSPRKTLRYLADEELINVTREKNGKITYSRTSWFENRSVRFVEFYINKVSKELDPLTDEEEIAEQISSEQQPFN